MVRAAPVHRFSRAFRRQRLSARVLLRALFLTGCVPPCSVAAQTPASSDDLSSRLPQAAVLRLETELREKNLEADVPRPTFARGDQVVGRTDREITYEGNAEIRRGGMVIRADRLTYYEADDEVVAVGNVRVAR